MDFKPDYIKTEQGYAYKYPRPEVTTDCVILGFDGSELKMLIVKRGIEPFKGSWALPGGFLRMHETIEECAQRELLQETGVEQSFMKQFGVFSALDRDPRGRVVTVAFYALVKLTEVKGGDDAAEAKWVSLDEIPHLAFDHDMIVASALKHIREDIHFRPLGFELMPERFTLPQLQRLYEAILGVKFERSNFAKKLLKTGMLNVLGERAEAHGYRPPELYSFNRERYKSLKQTGTLRLEF